MPKFVDQVGRTVIVDTIPLRIISLVPSQSELLYDLGLDKEVAGITKFCVHPEKWFHNKTRVGGTKSIKMDVIADLQPDLIIANKEENEKEQVDELAKTYPVWTSDVKTREDAYEMITRIGELTNKDYCAQELIRRIKDRFAQQRIPIPAGKKLRAAYLIWRNPYMTPGGDTFISSMMLAAGFDNVFRDYNRYPEITVEELENKNLEVLLLSSEPYPFKQHHANELLQQLPNARIFLVNGEMFSWYGSRLLRAPGYFKYLMEQVQQ